MPIYIQTGTNTSNLSEFKTEDPFKWLSNYKPDVFSGRLDSFKKRKAKYFISGYIEVDDFGKHRRSNDTLIRRSLIILDYDDMSVTDEKFLDTLQEKIGKYNYIAYPSISNGLPDKGTRYRLVLQPDRPLLDFEYKVTVKRIVDLIDIELGDNSNFTWSQTQGLPAVRDKDSQDFQMTVNQGEKFPIGEIERPKPKQYVSRGENSAVGAIAPETAIEWLKEYVADERNDLTDYSNCLSAIMVLAKAVQSEEITHDTAIECCEILSLGNVTWRDGNISKFYRELENSDVRTPYTFRVKFHDMLHEPKSIKDLHEVLSMLGEEWRNKNTDQNGICKVMPHYTIANYLKNNLKFLLIGEDKDMSQLFFYDLDQGIYRSSETDMHQLITKLDYRTKLNNWKDVISYLRVDAEQTKLFDNPNLIPCNNGLYEENTGKLLPFSPDYAIITKLETDYNPNAKLINHKLNNGEMWNIDSWLSELVNDDAELLELMYQIFNESFNSNKNRKALGFFIGKSNSGKGTLAKLLTNIIGSDKVSSLKIEDFKDKFRVANLEGKVANIGDDISTSYLDNVQDLMSLASGDAITIENKFGHAYRAELKTFCLFSGEAMPRVQNKNDGWYIRLKILPFTKGYTAAEAKPEIKDILINKKDVKEYVLKKALETKFDRFIQPKATADLLSEYRKDNDYTFAFVVDEYIENGLHEHEKVPTNFIKDSIQSFIYSHGSKQTVNYHYLQEVIKYLEEKTEHKYEKKKVRYSIEEIRLLRNGSIIVGDRYFSSNGTIWSLVKLE